MVIRSRIFFHHALALPPKSVATTSSWPFMEALSASGPCGEPEHGPWRPWRRRCDRPDPGRPDPTRRRWMSSAPDERRPALDVFGLLRLRGGGSKTGRKQGALKSPQTVLVEPSTSPLTWVGGVSLHSQTHKWFRFVQLLPVKDRRLPIRQSQLLTGTHRKLEMMTEPTVTHLSLARM